MEEGLGDTVAHILPELLGVGHIGQLLVVKEAPVRCLNRVGEGNSDFPEDYRARCGLLEGVNFEDAGVVAEHRRHIAQQFGEQTGFVVEAVDDGELRAIDKSVLFSGVAVEIKKHEQLFPKEALVLCN